MSQQIYVKVINKLRIFAYSAATFSEKINGRLMIPVEKLDIVALTFSLLTFSATIPGWLCIIHAKHIKKPSHKSVDCVNGSKSMLITC